MTNVRSATMALVMVLVSPPAEAAWWHHEYATWYGPGFYGNRTACGQTLTRRLVGVAHRTLACGTRVAVRWRGMTIRTRVVDRGPWGVAGLNIDMTAGLSCWALTGGHPLNCSSKVIYWRVLSR